MGTASRRQRHRAQIEIGKRLRAARLAMKLTQEAVAERLNRPQSFVSKCEAGERRLDVSELKQLASMYGKSLDDFVG